eukprot:m.583463 g.583463  ORF g.583463 m.583463 type:complete len:51 (-) comp57956_c0_seq11:1089-1241(-)
MVRRQSTRHQVLSQCSPSPLAWPLVQVSIYDPILDHLIIVIAPLVRVEYA